MSATNLKHDRMNYLEKEREIIQKVQVGEGRSFANRTKTCLDLLSEEKLLKFIPKKFFILLKTIKPTHSTKNGAISFMDFTRSPPRNYLFF
jgi:hypothetical protein